MPICGFYSANVSGGAPLNLVSLGLDPGASMPADDRRRSNLGVVACAVALEGGRVRLCFDDVKSKSAQWPPGWQTEGLYTWLECDAADFGNAKLSERQLADIGLTLVARLAALAKA